MKREEILDKIIEEQQRVIDSLKQSVDRYKTASDLDEDDTSDPDDLARQTEAKDMQLRYEKLLQKEKRDMEYVLAEKDKEHQDIEMGSVVETDKHLFFLGVALPVIKGNGKEIYCISPEAPIYKNLMNKKPGDQVQVGNAAFEILTVS